jgi:DNA repair protein RadC
VFCASSLTTPELLALILGSGNASDKTLELVEGLLTKHGRLIGLARQNLYELCSEPGVEVLKAGQIRVTLALGRWLVAEAIAECPTISFPADAATLLMAEMAVLEQEHLRVLLLDTRNRLVANHLVYVRILNTSLIRVGEVYREAIRPNCAAMFVAHNHPSGDPSPSPEDVAGTRALVRAGRLLDIALLDHLVIGQGRFVSLKEMGLGFA